MKIGLCTGGGDCPGLNTAIRAVVKHAVGSYGHEVIGIMNSITGLMESPPTTRSLDLDDVSNLLAVGGTILGTSNKGSPFKDPKKKQEAFKNIEKSWKQLGLDGLIVIGGDGTQSMANALSEEGYPIIGIPKTIDNDLPGTDLTIGFRTAIDIASEAAARLATSAEAHNRIMILEVMGRDAGHIALQAGIAGGANVILIPEVPFSYDAIEKIIQSRKVHGRNSSLIVVAEGAYPKGSEPVFKSSGSSAVLGGIGNQVAAELQSRTGVDIRVTVLGHIQRGGSPNTQDRLLATSFGTLAVDLAHGKLWGHIVRRDKGQITSMAYKDLAPGRRLLDAEDPLVKTAEKIGIHLGR